MMPSYHCSNSRSRPTATRRATVTVTGSAVCDRRLISSASVDPRAHHPAAAGDDAHTMPEGDTVWLAGRRLHDALAGRVLTRTDFRVPQLATADLTGRDRDRGGQPRQAPAAPDRRRPDPAHPLPDGRRLAPLPPGRALARRARLAGAACCWRTTTGRRSATGCRWSSCSRRRPRGATRSATSARTCSGRTGTPTRPYAGSRADPDREIGEALLDQRNLAGIGNLYKAEVLLPAGRLPVDAGRATCRPRRRLVDRAHRLLMANRDQPAQVTTGDPRRGARALGVRARRPAVPPVRDADPVGRAGRPAVQRVTYWCPRCQPR